MYGKIEAEIAAIKPVEPAEQDILESLITTKTQTTHDFVCEWNKGHATKIDGSIADKYIQKHLSALQEVEAGEEPETDRELAIKIELDKVVEVKEVK